MLTFHGGIDTQGILPYGTAEEVRRKTRKYMDILGKNGGYILMASQAFEGDCSFTREKGLSFGENLAQPTVISAKNCRLCAFLHSLS